MTVVFFVIGVFAEGWGPPNDDYIWLIDNPIGFIPNSFWEGLFGAIWMLGLLTLSLGGFVAMTVRFRRSGLVERTQIKWVLCAALVFALTYAASLVVNWFGGSFGDGLLGFLFVFSIALIPISITAAITRYRLFEIDRIISRTLSYAAVVIVLGALFLGMVTLVTALLPTQNSLAVAGATLVVAALFNPIRRRIQYAVDRRFNRSGYRAEELSEQFNARLRESLTTDELIDVWGETVNEALKPSATGIWIRDT